MDRRDANPVVGCSIVSPACTHCYAMAMAARVERMSGGKTHYAGTTKVVNGKPVWTGKLALAPDHIVTAPLRWKRPRRIFVNSMSDLFHEDMPEEWIDRVFAVMALAPQHTFQILTKRPERMRAYLTAPGKDGTANRIRYAAGGGEGIRDNWAWPLPNVWLGVTAEDQARADERIPDMLATPAAVRFVSAEPLLGPLDLYNGDPDPRLGGHSATKTFIGDWWEPGDDLRGPSRHGLDWVIVGGESGPGSRPMHPNWVRSIRDQCAAAGVAFHFKQWGEFGPAFNADLSPTGLPWSGAAQTAVAEGTATVEQATRRIGKRRAGRTLDGKIHDAFPEVP